MNAAAQQAVVDIIKALDPRSPTLYWAVLPKGAELVKAVGKSGFRGSPAPAARWLRRLSRSLLVEQLAEQSRRVGQGWLSPEQ